jgi:hypothetical protein
MNNAELINQTSGNVEYFTPAEIIFAARRTLGGIDLDPASCAAANERVKARLFYSAEDDGFKWTWKGRIWMNHPFGRRINRNHPKWEELCRSRGVPVDAPMIPGNEDWVNKLEADYEAGHVKSACCITYACTSEEWFQPLARRPQCFLTPRTNYILPNGKVLKGVSKGSVVTYYGENVARFAAEFAKLGVVKIEYRETP